MAIIGSANDFFGQILPAFFMRECISIYQINR